MRKTKVIEALNHLPEEFKTEELIDRLIFIEKVEKGMEDAKLGKTITLDQAKERALKWSK